MSPFSLCMMVAIMVQIFYGSTSNAQFASWDDWDSSSFLGPRKTQKPWTQWKPTRPTRTPKPKPTQAPSPIDDNAESTGCGVQGANFQPNLAFSAKHRVINGNEAKPHSWPWVVGLISTRLSGQFMCGGTLLRAKDGVEASDIVLTAAHCVTQSSFFGKPSTVSPSSLSIAAGRHRHNVPGEYNQVQRVSAIRAHPSYGNGPQGGAVNDVAVLKLASPIKFTDAVRPICLPEQGAAIPVNLKCVAAGWGRNDTQNQFISAEALQQVVVPVHSAETCSNGWDDMYKEESMVCAGTKDSGVCNGDSGSTMMCKDGDRWVQHGVVSFGVGGSCVAEGKPDVYARVAGFSNWIKQQIKELSTV